MTERDFPNLRGEIYLGNLGHVETVSKYANVTKRLMERFLDGEAELTADEVIEIHRHNQAYSMVELSIGYLLSPSWVIYSKRKRKHHNKIAILIARYHSIKDKIRLYGFRKLYGVVDIESVIDTYNTNGYMTRSAYNFILHEILWTERHIKPNTPPRDI